jgi:hypothetical protein
MLHVRLKKLIDTGIFCREVAYTRCDVSWFVENRRSLRYLSENSPDSFHAAVHDISIDFSVTFMRPVGLYFVCEK